MSTYNRPLPKQKIITLISAVILLVVILFLTYYPISKLIESPNHSSVHLIDIFINIIIYSFVALLIIAGMKADNKFSLKNIIKFSFQNIIYLILYFILIIGVCILAALWLSLGH